MKIYILNLIFSYFRRDSFFFFFLLIFRENLREFYCGIANKKSNDDSTMVLLLVRNIHLGIRSF